jgi:hypothetical protein
MDVHPPHQSIHSWRDFAVHLVTITIGLLIALGLEAAVEWLHHRHLVHVAHASISQEMAENRRILASDLSSVQQDQARIADDIRQLVALRDGVKGDPPLHYHLDWSDLSDAAWHTAQSTGAVNFMDYPTAQALTGVYTQQRVVSERGLKVFEDQTQAIAPVFFTGKPSLLSKDEMQIVLLRSADVLLELKGIEQLLKELDEEFAAELSRTRSGG